MWVLSNSKLTRKIIFIVFFTCIVAGIAGCGSRGSDEIIVIIEDPGIPTDTASTPPIHTPTSAHSSTTQTPPATRTMSLTGAVVLLKNDLETGNARIMVSHCEALLETVESESASAQGERKRTLDLFYLKLSSLKRAITSYEEDGIPPPLRGEFAPQLDELHELARRIEGRD